MARSPPMMLHALLEEEVPPVGSVGVERGVRATEVNEFDGIVQATINFQNFKN